jgi:uncharacterized membrane-anchored protein YjiN (DUF445 family)
MNNNQNEEKNLAAMIRDITLYYVKFYYDNYLKENNKQLIEEKELHELIENIYELKQKDLRQYIRDTLKQNLQENYPRMAVENILSEMFQDKAYAKQRVFEEIISYQISKTK